MLPPGGKSILKNLILKRKHERRILNGHLWVFSNEVKEVPGERSHGELVCIRTSSGRPLGHALFNPRSLIVGRLLEGQPEKLDQAYFEEHVSRALELRHRYLPEQDCYRLVHGESDLLPGLVVDRFSDHLVVQTLTLGMEDHLEEITRALESLCKPACIIERNDSRLRSYEGLEERISVLFGSPCCPLQVRENGILYEIDLLAGQKTGFFLDQKFNRRHVARYAAGCRVLDCFCNTGGFGLNTLQAGAQHVTALDSSKTVLEQASRNARLNGFEERFDGHCGDVFEFLEDSRGKYDLIILDPPAFTSNRKQVPRARKAYQKLNELACRRVEAGGLLATASCSFHITEETFYRCVQQGVYRARRRLQLLERHSHAPDHPSLPAMPETSYLKMGIYRAW